MSSHVSGLRTGFGLRVARRIGARRMFGKVCLSGRVCRMAAILALVGFMVGCGSSPPSFQLDMVYLRKNQDADTPYSREQLTNLAEVLTALFGTPDEPYVIADAKLGMHDVMETRNLDMAAGPVGSDELGRAHGLYRQHCAHCHGVSGDGAGPTAAYLNPYPRDYRKGIFKFKSTPSQWHTRHCYAVL